ncbi:MAG: acylphosphatase [Chloroflexota bacterium]|nr:acylphosphatase [Chloroflexota bacterium]
MTEDGRQARLEATVHGVVQGVGFRYFVRREAARLGLKGWVANRTDGSVAVVAEGPVGSLDGLVRALHTGPPSAHVERVDVRREEARGSFERFEVRAGAHRGD